LTSPSKPKQGQRTKRAELPKPVIRMGSLGFFPLNPLTASYLHQAYGEVVIGYHDTTETQVFKSRPVLQVQQGGNKEELSLEGRFYNGFADALYRGKLCQVVLATPTSEGLPNLLEDFVDYLEKLLALGFFVPKKEIVKRDPVAELVPCFILTGDGLLFSRFITALVRYMQELASRHPILTESLRTRILGRFVRGLPAQDEPADFLNNELLTAGTRQVALANVPRRIRIAGGSTESHDIILKVLEAKKLSATVESRSRNAVERLEFEHAMWRVARVVIPSLADGKALSSDEVKKLLPRVEAGIFAIGKQRQAFDESDSVESILPSSSKASASKSKPAGKKRKIPLSQGDAAMLSGLVFYADALGLPAEKEIFETLATQVASCCEDT
jgi:hypothetical protein